MNFARLKKNLKADSTSLSPVRLAILGDAPTQFLRQAIQGYGVEVGIGFDIFEGEYDQIERQILDPGSDLYAHRSRFVLIFQSTQKLHAKFVRTSPAERSHFASDHVVRVRELLRHLHSLEARVIWCNFTEPTSDVFGNFANKTSASFTAQVRTLNVELMQVARDTKALFICDLASLQNEIGRERAFSPRTFVNTGMVFDLEAWVPFAKRVTDIVASLTGSPRKALVLDLDNTIWGGVIGDDGLGGIEIGDLGVGRAFTEVQLWAKELRERGIIIAICSKNDEAIAREPFEKHPDMILGSSDVAMFVANWENKVDNIRHIQATLNIGFDSMVFVDDNPVERDMVRTAIPEVCVPELPDDPADYAPYLRSLNLFEATSFTEEDATRTEKYREEAMRVEFQRSFSNEAEYLASLGMVSEVKPFDRLSAPRIAQLTQRSNQFNLRTTRYTEQDIEAIGRSPEHMGFSFTLSDKFGDHGLVSVVIVRMLSVEVGFLDTWLMSCRVLKRGMERFVLNTIVRAAQERGLSRLVGEHIPTAKNGLVKNHYRDLGFDSVDGRWERAIATFEHAPVQIRTKELP
jgi:FkbH-like protein